MSDAVDRAVEWLLARQAPAGWWTGELETNVTMTAEHVMLWRHYTQCEYRYLPPAHA